MFSSLIYILHTIFYASTLNAFFLLIKSNFFTLVWKSIYSQKQKNLFILRFSNMHNNDLLYIFREPQVLPRTVPDTIIEIFLRTMYKQKTGTYNISIQFAPSWYSRNRITICNRSTCFWTMLTYSYPNRFHYSQNYYKRERFKRTYFTNWKWRCQRNIIWILYSL